LPNIPIPLFEAGILAKRRRWRDDTACVIPIWYARFRFRWTDHALDKAALLGIARADVEQAVIKQHQRRRHSVRSADWLLTSGRLVIAYDHPDHADTTTARVITLWRQR
jgi:hypothetical protein